TLKRVYLLIDARHGLKKVDDEALDALDLAAVSYQIVLTKADKLKKGEAEKVQAATLKAIAKRPAAYPAVLVTSAEKGDGLPELRAKIMRPTGGELWSACGPGPQVVRCPHADPPHPDRPAEPAHSRGRLRAAGPADPRLPGTRDQLAGAGRGAGRRRLSRRRSRHARLRRDRQARRPERLRGPRPRRRHGRSGPG